MNGMLGRQRLSGTVSFISPENILKWEAVHPEPDRFAFDASDRYVEFGAKNHMAVIGHTLVWHNQTPKWVFEDDKGKPLNRDALLQRLREHIQAVVGRYKDESRDGMVTRLPGTQFLFQNRAPNLMLKLRLAAGTHRWPAVARVVVVAIDPTRQILIADSRDNSIHGMRLLDAEMQPVKLPLGVDWMNAKPEIMLHIIPQQKWPEIGNTYSRIFVELLDEHDEIVALVPVSIPLAPQK